MNVGQQIAQGDRPGKDRDPAEDVVPRGIARNLQFRIGCAALRLFPAVPNPPAVGTRSEEIDLLDRIRIDVNLKE